MRIGLFAHRLAQADATGIGRYVRDLTTALGRVSPDTDDVTISSAPEEASADWIGDGVSQRAVPWPRRPTQALWCLGGGPRLERAIGGLDVAHLLHAFPPVPTRAAMVVTIHDLFPLEHPDWYPRSERWTYRRSVALAGRRASRIVVPSRYVAGRLHAALRVAPESVTVVPHGVTGAFASERSEREIGEVCARFGVEPGAFAVSVERVSTRKNVVPLVRAMPQLGAPVPLLLIGSDGYGAASVRGEVARLNGSCRVLLTGYLSDADVAALVRGAGVLAHPALAEGFGMVPLEAMAAGTPVVGARTASLPEVVGDAGVLVDDPVDPRAWATALTRVLSSRELRGELSAAGRRRAADFSWDRAARTMLQIYRDVAGG